MRRASTGRRDANEGPIVAALRAAGAAVAIMAPPMPDLMVEYGGYVLMFEVKDRHHGKATWRPTKRNSAGDVPECLTPGEAKWWRAWIAQGGAPPIVVLDVEQALAAIAGPASRLADRRREHVANLDHAMDRAVTIADEAFGLGPVESTDAMMSRIEGGIQRQRERIRELARELAEANARWAADVRR